MASYLALQRKLQGPNQGPSQFRSQSPSASSDSATPTRTERRGRVFFTISFNNPICLAAYSVLNLDLVDNSFFLFFLFDAVSRTLTLIVCMLLIFARSRSYRKQRWILVVMSVKTFIENNHSWLCIPVCLMVFNERDLKWLFGFCRVNTSQVWA